MEQEFGNSVNELINYVFDDVIPVLKNNGLKITEVTNTERALVKVALANQTLTKKLAEKIVNTAGPHLDKIRNKDLEAIREIKFNDSHLDDLFSNVVVAIDNKHLLDDECEDYIFDSVLYIIDCARKIV